jgi:hypothetical protein
MSSVPPQPAQSLTRVTESHTSGASWPAIFAGAAAAAALSLILVILGFGLGLSAISPWSNSGASGTTIGVSTAIWLAVQQILAAGLGGYLAGRLRVRWTDIDRDEVYFRDTAHGMLSWAIATLATAAFLGSALTGIVSSGAQAVGGVASSSVSLAQGALAGSDSEQGGGDQMGGQLTYFVDELFRGDQSAPPQDAGQQRSEAATIFLRSLRNGELNAEDRAWVSRMVAQNTGLDPQAAEKRVQDVYTKTDQAITELKTSAQEAADTARKAAATTALWMFVALLSGAFFASLAAIYGGRQRDMSTLTSNVR